MTQDIDHFVMVELVAKEVTRKPAYCALVAVMFVADEVPSVVSMVKAPAVKFALVRLDIPAMAMSIYWVSPLLVVSPQVPDSVPVTGSGRSKRVVRLTVMIYSVSTNSQSAFCELSMPPQSAS